MLDAATAPAPSFPNIPEYELPIEPQTRLGKILFASGIPLKRVLGIENCHRYFRWYTCGKHQFARHVNCSSPLCYRCAVRLGEDTVKRHEAQIDWIAKAPKRVLWFISALIPCARTKDAINELGAKVVANLNSVMCEHHERIAWAFLAGFQGDCMVVDMIFISGDNTDTYESNAYYGARNQRFKNSFKELWPGCRIHQTSTKSIRDCFKKLVRASTPPIIPDPKDRAELEIAFYHVRRMRYLQGNIKAIANITGPNPGEEGPEPELLRVTTAHPHGEGVHCPHCGAPATQSTGLLPIEDLEATRRAPPWRS